MLKIIPHVFGGFGNQLDHFCIPCRKATAFERLEPFPRLSRYLRRQWNRLLPFEQRTYISREGMNFDSRLLSIKPNETLYLDGCWQSEGCFKDVEEIIRADLVIEPPVDKSNSDTIARIRDSLAVAMHVRFFDASPEDGIHNVARDYYDHAVAQIELLAPGSHYFVFSDKPEAARQRISLPDARITIVSHNIGDENAYLDLWLMNQCRHFIIANSTFSWWGAWLGKFKDKIVVCPADEVRGITWWGFDGLLPDEWIKVSCS